MTAARRLGNGNIIAPVSIRTRGVIAEAVAELRPGDPGYEAWDEYLRALDEANQEGRPGADPSSQEDSTA